MEEDFERQMKLTFIEEALQLLGDVEQCFLDLENDPESKEQLDKIFRIAHNLKGSAKAVGFDSINEFCHEFESFLIFLKRNTIPKTKEIISLLLTCTDHIKQMVEFLQTNADARFDSSELLATLHGIQRKTQEDTEATPLYNDADFATESQDQEKQDSPEELTILEPSAFPAEDQPGDETSDPPVAQETVAITETQQSPLMEAKAKTIPTEKGKANKPQIDESIRVSLQRLEQLIDSVGEIVILQSVLTQQTVINSDHALRKTIHQMVKVTKEIQDISMSLRMVKLKPIFQKMQRIARDTSSTLKKDIRFVTGGEETEVDKTVFERIGDPLVHLVRNAADHGIEDMDLREQIGKTGHGQISLRAFHSADKLIIEIADDGRGLDAEKLKQSAIKKGLLSPGVILTEEEAQQIIFMPGFSSKSEVTDVSGRGVGMDVVKTNVTELGGTIHTTSSAGKGTTFRIELPLTLAIIDGMIVKSGTAKFIIPLAHVHETVRLDRQGLRDSSGLGEVLILREETLPVYRLHYLLSLPQESSSLTGIVVRTDKNAFVIAVNEIIASTQVVVKQLGRETQANIKGVSGSTILGDGRPALILEVAELVANYGHLSKPVRRAA